MLQEKDQCVERVLQECRAYLCNKDLNHALISSVGAALSLDCRTILRENGLSLKRILESFPHEFEVSRIQQGRKLVYWYGAGSAVDMSSSQRGQMNKVVRWMLKKSMEKSMVEKDAAMSQVAGKHAKVPEVAERVTAGSAKVAEKRTQRMQQGKECPSQ